jgi:hypothetical protein
MLGASMLLCLHCTAAQVRSTSSARVPSLCRQVPFSSANLLNVGLTSITSRSSRPCFQPVVRQRARSATTWLLLWARSLAVRSPVKHEQPPSDNFTSHVRFVMLYARMLRQGDRNYACSDGSWPPGTSGAPFPVLRESQSSMHTCETHIITLSGNHTAAGRTCDASSDGERISDFGCALEQTGIAQQTALGKHPRDMHGPGHPSKHIHRLHSLV